MHVLGHLATAAVALTTTTGAWGAVAYNDFGNATGNAANVTTIGDGGSGSLLDITTGAAFATLSVSSGFAGTTTNSPSVPTEGEAFDTFDGILNLSGYLFSQTVTNAFVFSGLDTTKTYDVVIAGTPGNQDDEAYGIVIKAAGFTNATTLGTDVVISTTTVAHDTTQVMQTGDYVVHYTGITPNGDGTISLDVLKTTLGTATSSRVNAIRFAEVVPEPASVALLAAGGLAGLVRRRR